MLESATVNAIEAIATREFVALYFTSGLNPGNPRELELSTLIKNSLFKNNIIIETIV
tara:strand:- start:351 stop:521 length:171 start_codon:yes stop_codon:yes gene_type:complete